MFLTWAKNQVCVLTTYIIFLLLIWREKKKTETRKKLRFSLRFPKLGSSKGSSDHHSGLEFNFRANVRVGAI